MFRVYRKYKKYFIYLFFLITISCVFTEVNSKTNSIKEREEIRLNNEKQLKLGRSKSIENQKADITFNFPNVKLEEFARFIANLNKKILIGDKLLQGNITINTPEKLTLKKLMDVFKALLNSRGLDYVISGDYLQIFQKSDSEVKVYQINYLKSADIAKTLSDIFKMSFNVGGVPQRVMINSIDQANAVVVLAPKEKQIEIANAIKELDWRRRQVLMDVKFIEVTYNSAFGFGVTGGGNYKDFSGLIGPRASSTKDGYWNPGKDPSIFMPTFTGQDGSIDPYVGIIGKDSNFFIDVEALNQVTNFKVLSNPTLLTAENQKANIKITTNRPIATSGISLSSDQSLTPTLGWKDIGLTLEITPRINADRDVSLDISVLQTSIIKDVNIIMATRSDTSSEQDTSSFVESYPVIAQRNTKTSATIKDNQTLVISGVLQGNKKIEKDKVPFFGEVPYIGWIFTTETEAVEQNEVLVLIRPVVIENKEEGDRLTQKMTSEIVKYDKRTEEKIKKMIRGERDDSWDVFNAYQYFNDEPYRRDEQDVVPQSWFYPDR